MLFFSRERHCGGGVQACRHKMTEKPITDIARVAAFGGEFSSYPWMPQSKSVCEELHAASASRMSLRWLVFRQASEAFSSSSRALRLAVPHLFHCWKSVTCCTLRIRDAALSCIVPYLWPSLIYRST